MIGKHKVNRFVYQIQWRRCHNAHYACIQLTKKPLTAYNYKILSINYKIDGFFSEAYLFLCFDKILIKFFKK